MIGFLPMTEGGADAEPAFSPADVLPTAPASIPLAAAALPSAPLTALQALSEHAKLRARQRILINGTGGGVDRFATHFAKQAGATVIATAVPRRAAAGEAGGADQSVDDSAVELSDAIAEPVDVVINRVRPPDAAMLALFCLVTAQN